MKLQGSQMRLNLEQGQWNRESQSCGKSWTCVSQEKTKQNKKNLLCKPQFEPKVPICISLGIPILWPAPRCAEDIPQWLEHWDMAQPCPHSSRKQISVQKS